MSKNNRSLKRRALNAVCSITLICAGVYILIVGVTVGSGMAAVAAIASVAAPVVVADGGGVGEMIVGVLEGLVDGVVAIIEGVSSLFSF